MTDLRARLREDITRAVKAGDSAAATCLRLVAAAIHNEEIARRPVPLEAEGLTRVLQRELKLRREAAEEFRKGGRAERAAAEEREATLIGAYLPKELTDSELEAEARAVLRASPGLAARGMGPAIGAVVKAVRGRADGARVRAVLSRIMSSGVP